MSPKPGKNVSLVPPAEPKAAQAAADAEPGSNLEPARATPIERPPPPPPDQNTAEDEQATSWIEIELVDEAGEKVPGVRYKVVLPDASVVAGTTDAYGNAHVRGFRKGSCAISFPDLDAAAWEEA